MPLPTPKFDTRTYQEILQEALARIPAHNPEWSNFNDSDPGITLLQLFAFMSESIIYRTNLIPERNRMKFLKLLDIRMRPASTARGLVQFSSKTVATLGEGQEVLAGNVPFRTQNGLTVLPLEGKLYYKQAITDTAISTELATLYRQLYAAIEQSPQNLQLYETRIFAPPAAGNLLPVLALSQTVDACFWLALLAPANTKPAQMADLRGQIAGKVLTLGIMPALGADGRVLYPLGPSAASNQPSLVFEMPRLQQDGNEARYRQLTVTFSQDPMAAPGVVEVLLPSTKEDIGYWDNLEPLAAGTGNYPPALDNTDDADRLLSWIRIRSPDSASGNQQASHQVTVALNWLGINVAQVVQEVQANAEQLPRGTGLPDQMVVVRNTPVIPDSLRVSVNGQLWQRVDDLNVAVAEVPGRSPRLSSNNSKGGDTEQAGLSQVYQLDPEAGEIRFGNGLHGSRPPAGARIEASYHYGGGLHGNVGIGVINKFDNGVGLKVSNPVPTWGADDQESLAEAERRIPAHLRHNERLVSSRDYHDITLGTPGVDMGRVEVLPLFHPDYAELDTEGVVSVMVIPKHDPHHPDAPQPDRLFLETVCAYLEPRRILTTELHVRGPLYEPLVVSVGVEVIPGRAQGPVLNAVQQALQDFLSPLRGGFDGQGWPLNTAVETAELAAAVTRVDGVASVQGSLLLGDGAGNSRTVIPLRGLQLPRLAAVAVGAGTPTPLQDVLGLTGATTGQGSSTRTPVPVIPEVC